MDIIDGNVNILRKGIKYAVSLGSFEDVEEDFTGGFVAEVVPPAVQLIGVGCFEDGGEPVPAIDGNGGMEVPADEAEVINVVALHIDHIISYELDILI